MIIVSLTLWHVALIPLYAGSVGALPSKYIHGHNGSRSSSQSRPFVILGIQANAVQLWLFYIDPDLARPHVAIIHYQNSITDIFLIDQFMKSDLKFMNIFFRFYSSVLLVYLYALSHNNRPSVALWVFRSDYLWLHKYLGSYKKIIPNHGSFHYCHCFTK